MKSLILGAGISLTMVAVMALPLSLPVAGLYALGASGAFLFVFVKGERQ